VILNASGLRKEEHSDLHHTIKESRVPGLRIDKPCIQEDEIEQEEKSST
jgi:hypothetical protein